MQISWHPLLLDGKYLQQSRSEKDQASHSSTLGTGHVCVTLPPSEPFELDSKLAARATRIPLQVSQNKSRYTPARASDESSTLTVVFQLLSMHELSIIGDRGRRRQIQRLLSSYIPNEHMAKVAPHSQVSCRAEAHSLRTIPLSRMISIG